MNYNTSYMNYLHLKILSAMLSATLVFVKSPHNSENILFRSECKELFIDTGAKAESQRVIDYRIIANDDYSCQISDYVCEYYFDSAAQQFRQWGKGTITSYR